MELPVSWIWFTPLVAVWVARWAGTFGTRVAALAYRPAPVRAGRADDVSVVVLAGGGTATLRRAVESWLASGVRRVIVLIGADDVAAQRIVERYPVHVLRRRPSDRASLRAGWQVATGGYVALTRADAVWAPDTVQQAAAAFADSGVAAVSVRENTVGGGVLARLTDMEMDLRALDGAPAASVRGAVTGWSATAVLRRSALEEVGEEFVAGRDAGWSGDVECLARLLIDGGHGLVHQRPARTWRPPPGRRSWLRDRLAADRAGWRLRARALARPRTWRRPGVALGMAAWMLAGPAALVGPAWVVAALVMGRVDVVLLLVAVCGCGQLVLLLPHLRRRPSSLPVAVLHAPYGTATALVRLAALLPARQPVPAAVPMAQEALTIDPALRLRPIRPRVASESITLPAAVPEPALATPAVPAPAPESAVESSGVAAAPGPAAARVPVEPSGVAAAPGPAAARVPVEPSGVADVPAATSSAVAPGKGRKKPRGRSAKAAAATAATAAKAAVAEPAKQIVLEQTVLTPADPDAGDRQPTGHPT